MLATVSVARTVTRFSVTWTQRMMGLQAITSVAGGRVGVMPGLVVGMGVGMGWPGVTWAMGGVALPPPPNTPVAKPIAAAIRAPTSIGATYLRIGGQPVFTGVSSGKRVPSTRRAWPAGAPMPWPTG